MIYIRRNRHKDIPGKWEVINTKLKAHDITSTFKDALVYFLWHCSTSFKSATKLFNFKKNK